LINAVSSPGTRLTLKLFPPKRFIFAEPGTLKIDICCP
jgi:hypothetical protein